MFDINEDISRAVEKAQTNKYVKPFPVDIFLSTPMPPQAWVFPTLLPEKALIGVTGKPESYKTFFCMWMAWRAAQGLPLFAKVTDSEEEPKTILAQNALKEPVDVLFVEEENGLPTLHSRFSSFPKPVPQTLHLLVSSGLKLTDQKYLAYILKYCEEFCISLLFLDPWSSLTGVENENDNAEISAVMDTVRHEIIDKHNISVVFIHHPAKGSEDGLSMRGAGDMAGKCDVHLSCEVEDREERLIRVSFEKMRLIDRNDCTDFKIKLIPTNVLEPLHFRYEQEAMSRSEEALSEFVNEIVDNMPIGTPISKSEVALNMGSTFRNKRFIRAWSDLTGSGRIYESVEKKNGHPLFVRNS